MTITTTCGNRRRTSRRKFRRLDAGHVDVRQQQLDLARLQLTSRLGG